MSLSRGEAMDVQEIGTPTMTEDPETRKKRVRTPEEEEANKRHKDQEQTTELRIRVAYLEGKIEELERNNNKLSKENDRLRGEELKLVRWQTKVEERENEIENLERKLKEEKQQAIDGAIRIKELEIISQQNEHRRLDVEEKITQLEEEIKKLYRENGSLKNETTKTTAAVVPTFADMLKKREELPEKTKIIEANKRQPKPTILIKPKDGESIKDIRMRLTRTIGRNDKINFQMVQTRTALVLQMATTQDEEKLINHPGIGRSFESISRVEKKNPLMIVYGIPVELQEKEVLEELIERNLPEITEEQKQLIKTRFKTGPRDRDRYHLVIEVPRSVREILLRRPKIYIGYEATNVKDYLVVTVCMKCKDYGHIARNCRDDERCGHCGEKGHKKLECPDKNKNKVCIPCHKKGKKCGVKTQQECPQYKMQLQRTIEKFDYGP